MAIAFARSIVLARLLGTENMAVAGLLGIILNFVEMTSDAGISKFVVQAKTEDGDALLATAHRFSMIRGAFFSILLIVLAYPIAYMFSVPFAAWAFAMVAFVPWIRAFINLDCYWQQRSMAFQATNRLEIAGQIAALVVAVVFGFLFQDYRAAVVTILAQPLFAALASRQLANRPYRTAFDRVVWII